MVDIISFSSGAVCPGLYQFIEKTARKKKKV
jgi:hypothetical protein